MLVAVEKMDLAYFLSYYKSEIITASIAEITRFGMGVIIIIEDKRTADIKSLAHMFEYIPAHKQHRRPIGIGLIYISREIAYWIKFWQPI